MSDWTNSHDLVYAFVCVSFLADGEVDESEKEAMRAQLKKCFRQTMIAIK